MFNQQADTEASLEELLQLVTPGVLGFYTHIEVTEVFAIRNGQGPVNVFTILVAEERHVIACPPPTFLGSRIKLRLLKGWTFGVKRHVKPLAELPDLLTTLTRDGRWCPSGTPLEIGPLTMQKRLFVPADSTITVPLNGVLKNNFWAGSHVLEWVSHAKTHLSILLRDPPAIQELSEAVQAVVPLRLASLTDRLGNILLQLPVEILIAKLGQQSTTGDATLSLRWHPKATPRKLQFQSDVQHDHVISGYTAASVCDGEYTLPMGAGEGMQRGVLWDDRHRVVLAATGGTAFIRQISVNMHALMPQDRIFNVVGIDGVENEERVGMSRLSPITVRSPMDPSEENWGARRIYLNEVAQLAADRGFVQYRPKAGDATAERLRALEDIRRLIRTHGTLGAYLWDPYLSATDVLRTLFYCPHAGAELRALTAGYPIPPPPEPEIARLHRLARWAGKAHGRVQHAKITFADEQRRMLDVAAGNRESLRLEYRLKKGPEGWDFHDRFLIFPRSNEGAMAWSLGTSVNNVGQQHHILQKVADGQPVLDAFNELWTRLNGPEHLIWKTP